MATVIKTYERKGGYYRCIITNTKAKVKVHGKKSRSEKQAVRNAKKFYKELYPNLNGIR